RDWSSDVCSSDLGFDRQRSNLVGAVRQLIEVVVVEEVRILGPAAIDETANRGFDVETCERTFQSDAVSQFPAVLLRQLHARDGRGPFLDEILNMRRVIDRVLRINRKQPVRIYGELSEKVRRIFI